MNTSTTLRFLGWVALTFGWLEANRFFFTAIADAIDYHNERMRLKAFLEVKELLRKSDEDESEGESEDEGEDKGATAMAYVIHNHNEQIRQKALLKKNYEDGGEDKSE